MDLPPLPSLRPIDSISPSFYSAALVCKAKAAWQQFGSRELVPATTGALLGSCFHAVMEMSNRGAVAPSAVGSQQAKAAFDEVAERLFARAHPLVRLKFSSPQKIPYYFQRRARAVALAVQAASATSVRAIERSKIDSQKFRTGESRIVERRLESQDGTIIGRLDLLDVENSKLTDYKSGHAPVDTTCRLTPAEVQQLRLYAYLARDNGHAAKRAAIVRGDGTEAEVDVSDYDAEREAISAKACREQFNQAVAAGCSFADLAAPSSANCPGCPCMPFCEGFWNAATPDWESNCGTNAEGRIIELRDAGLPGIALKTVVIDCHRGSAPRGTLILEQIPSQWLGLGSVSPIVGGCVRVVLAARHRGDPAQRVLRVDKIKSTTIWYAPVPVPG